MDNSNIKKTVVVYSGRFQPFHKGHYATYQKLASKFGADNVYIATSDKTDNQKSPFNFNEKREIMTKMFGISPNKIVQVKNPYAPKEVLDKFNPETTAYISAVGEKDSTRLGGKYFEPYKGVVSNGYDVVGYVYPVPSEPNTISGTDVRKWLSTDEEEAKKMFSKIYPKWDSNIFKLITSKLKLMEGLVYPGHRGMFGEDDLEPNDIDELVLAADSFIESYFNEDAPSPNRNNPVMDKQITYTAKDGLQKKITVGGALRLPKQHPAHIQASKMVAQSPKPIQPVRNQDTPPVPGLPLQRKQTPQGKIDAQKAKFFKPTYIYPTPENPQPTTKQSLKGKDFEDINIDVDKGDTVLMGKFKNHPVTVKDISTDDHGMPTINGKKATTFRTTDEMSQSQLKNVDRYADSQLNPVDVQFTKHFFDRVNDPRNGREITEPELTAFFTKISKDKKHFIDFLERYKEIVVKDKDTNINIPFVKMANKAIAKTVMRKGNFMTSNPTLVNEGVDSVSVKPLAEFIKYAKKRLELKQFPKIKLITDGEFPKQLRAFGGYDPETDEIHLYVKGRNVVDVIRTLAHELVHLKQKEDGRVTGVEDGATGSDIENEANAAAGILLRDFGKVNPAIYESKYHTKLLVEGGDYVICNECGEKMKQIQYRHLLYKHNMNLDEYKQKYPNSKLVCESAKNIGDKNPMKNDVTKAKHAEIMKSQEHSDTLSRVMLGKNTGNIRADLLENNKNPKYRQKISEGVTKSYINNPSLRSNRREVGKNYGFGNPNTQQTIGKILNWTNPNDKDKFQLYTEVVRRLTDINYQKYFNEIPNAKLRSRVYHLDHKYSINDGFKDGIPVEIISHYKNLEVIPHSINESKSTNSNILLEELIRDIQYSNNPISNKILLQCGGAYGHMNHPFDVGMNLTFGDLKKIISNALDGTLGVVREKTDGQALAISWRNGKLIAARNKGHLANSGANALDSSALASKFAGRGALSDAYNFAMKDLSAAISALSESERQSIFKGGSAFCNLEVIYPENANVIPYGQSLLIFHNVVQYDEKGNAIGEVKGAESKLAAMVKQVNADVQSKYTIQGPPITKLPKDEKLSSQKGKFNSMLSKLQSEFGLSDKDGVADYHYAWWMKFVNNSKKNFTKEEKEGLANRWAFDDKKFSIKSIADEDARKWADGVDKDAKDKITKGNLRKFEDIFLGVGAEVLSFMSSVLTAQPDSALQSIKSSLESAISQIQSTGTGDQIKKLEKELARLNAIGGFDKLVPNEGLVFFYKGNTYKLTGTFAPLNQILGIFKFSR